MSKPNTKKMLTVMISVAMVFSAFAILSLAATPAYATGSATMTSNPLYFVPGVTTVSYISTTGAGFGAGSVVYFYISTTTSASGIIGSYIGTVSLSSGVTDLANVVNITVPSSVTPGSYYILASDSSSPTAAGATFNANVAVTVSSISPEVSLSVNSQAAGGTIGISSVTGHPFDAGSSIALILNKPGSSITVNVNGGSSNAITTTSSGLIPTSTYFTVPTNLPQGTYTLVVQETTAYSASTAPNGAVSGSGGITADTSFTLNPAITVTFASGNSISGATSSQFYISGEGFAASAAIGSSTSSTPSSDVTVAGVDALQGGVTTGTDGSFSNLHVTGLVSAITTTGPQTIVITTNPPTSANTFASAVFVSNPTQTPTVLVTDTVAGANYGTTSGFVADTLSITAYNMLGAQGIAIYFGGSNVVSSTTDANGYYSTTSYTVPQLPGGTYTVYAQMSSSSTVTEYASTTFTILPQITFSNTEGYALSSGTNGAQFTVSGNGLAPNGEYAITDSGLISAGGTGNVVYDTENSLVTTGLAFVHGSSASDYLGVQATFTGTFEITYYATYGTATTLATGSNETISVSGSSLTTQSDYYYAIGPVTVTSSTPSYNPSASPAQTVSLTVTGLIPVGSAISTSTYVVADTYSIVLGSVSASSSAVSVKANGETTAATTFNTSSSSTNSATLTFAASSLSSSGLNTINVVYSNFGPGNDWGTAGADASSAVVGSLNVLSSTPGTSALAALAAPGTNYPGLSVGYYLYDFPASSTVTYYYYTPQGKKSATVSTDSNGIANVSFSVPFVPAGSYQLTFMVTVSGSNYFLNTTMGVQATLSSVPSSSSSYPTSQAAASYYPGGSVTLYAYGLSPQSFYGLYLYDSNTSTMTSSALGYFTTDTSGSNSAGTTVTLPMTLASGDRYYIDAMAATSSPTNSSAIANYNFMVGSYNNIFGPTFNYTTNTESAFPTQFVNFVWTPSTPPAVVTSGGTNGPVEVTVYLNETAYTTFPVAYTAAGPLLGSFLAPNNDTGAWWFVTLGWTQIQAGNTHFFSMTNGTTSPKLALVSGAGALVINIGNVSATIQTAIGQAMKVPLAELNATIVKLNSTAAQITTAFGTMTSTLSAINATVTSIENGQVLVQTDVGSIMTSFASLNSSIQTFNGDVATISTSLGNVTTSLSSINTKVVSNGNNLVTVETDLGNISGEIVATHGNTSQIITALGYLNATVQKVNSNTQGFGTLEVFLIVIVVLVLITLVLSFMAVSAANKASRRATEEKKQ